VFGKKIEDPGGPCVKTGLTIIEMVIVKRIDVFPDAGQRRNLGVQRPGRVEPVVRQVPVEVVALGFEGVENGWFAPHDPHVGPEGLVGAEQVEDPGRWC
jgi:hypothetical protein